MKITRVDCHVLLDPAYDVNSTNSSQDDIVVEIHTDEGFTGIGETDVNAWVARACIEAPGTHTMDRGLARMLLGADPLKVETLWERLYVGSAMTGRRGAVVHAIGALDMALHDLRGKVLNKPCWELLGGSAHRSITPYASLQPEVSSWERYCISLLEWVRLAKARGFRAAKLEITPFGPYKHLGLNAGPEQMTELIAAARREAGPDFVLMVDLQYAFADAVDCLRAIEPWADFNLFFVETPLSADDLDGYARLAQQQPIPIAAGEWLATRFEFLDLMDRGKVRVVQPDVGRVGGFTECRRVCNLARERGLTVVPHLWKTGISIAAAVNMAAATPHCAFIEYLPEDLCASNLRKELVRGTPVMENGTISLPRTPGLGIELNRDALARFEEVAAHAYGEGGLRAHAALPKD
jgi:L-alanine-DL-glutamate epimerase-like enolase superfamily enzyme